MNVFNQNTFLSEIDASRYQDLECTETYAVPVVDINCQLTEVSTGPGLVIPQFFCFFQICLCPENVSCSLLKKFLVLLNV